MELLTIEQFKSKQKEQNCLLVDVREEYEFEDENIGGLNIPLAEVLTELEKIQSSPTIIFLCRSGKRSVR